MDLSPEVLKETLDTQEFAPVWRRLILLQENIEEVSEESDEEESDEEDTDEEDEW